MQPSESREAVPPFFQILAAADQIRVQELDPQSVKSGFGGSVPPEIKGSGELNSNQRAFLVYVSENGSTPKKLAADGMEPGTDLSRDFLIESAHLLLESKDFLLGRNLFSFVLKQKNH